MGMMLCLVMVGSMNVALIELSGFFILVRLYETVINLLPNKY